MINFTTIYQWSLIIAAALIPSGFYPATLAFIALGGFCWLVNKRFGKIAALKSEPQFLFAVLLYVYVFAGCFFSINHREALSSLSAYFPLLFYPLFIGTSGIVSENLIKKIEKVFLLSTIISMLAMIGYAAADILLTGEKVIRINDADYDKFSSFGLTRVFGHYHPTYVAMFVNHSIVILVRMMNRNAGEMKKPLLITYVAAFGFLVISLLLLNSMIGLLTFTLLLLHFSMAGLKKRGIKIFTRTALISIFVLLAAAFVYYNPLKLYKLDTLKNRELKITDNYEERNLLTIRLSKWDTHLKIIREHFFFGTTEGDISAIRKATYLEKGFKDLALHNYNAHNQYLEIFSTFGLFGFLIFATMIIAAYTRKRSGSFYLFMLIFFISSLTESIWELSQGFNYFMFFFALYTSPLAAGVQERVLNKS